MTTEQIIAELDRIFAMLGKNSPEYPARKALKELRDKLAEEAPANG